MPLTTLDAEPNNTEAFTGLTTLLQGGGEAKSDPTVERALVDARRVHRERGDATSSCGCSISSWADRGRRQEG